MDQVNALVRNQILGIVEMQNLQGFYYFVHEVQDMRVKDGLSVFNLGNWKGKIVTLCT